MILRTRLDVRLVGGLFRVIARTAAMIRNDNGRCERNPDPVMEYVHKRPFADNGEAWKLALRVEQALRADGTLNLPHWDVVRPGDLPADSLLPPRLERQTP